MDRDGAKILLKVDPIRFQAIELTIPSRGEATWREMEFTEEFDSEIAARGFEATGPFEFNLYEAGLLG